MNGGASVIRALVRNSGTCRPDGAAGQWSGRGLRLVVWSENPKQQICEGESSDAGHRGGPDRSSPPTRVPGRSPSRRHQAAYVPDVTTSSRSSSARRAALANA